MLRLITPPAVEPLSLQEAKDHLRVQITGDDDLISSWIVAARSKCETELRRAFITSTWELTLDGFPIWYSGTLGLPYANYRILERPISNSRLAITLPKPNLQSIVSITYVDTGGAIQTLSPSDYQVITGAPGYVVPAYGKTWPATRDQPEAVNIHFNAGYGDDATDVPDVIKSAMRLLIGNWYENRESTVIGGVVNELPTGVCDLLAVEDWGSYP